jgi:hypothetical protein
LQTAMHIRPCAEDSARYNFNQRLEAGRSGPRKRGNEETRKQVSEKQVDTGAGF